MRQEYEGTRSAARCKVMLSAKLIDGSSEAIVRIVDLSCQGALVVGDVLPAMNSPVILRCGSQSVPGCVVWRDGMQAGVSFDSKIVWQSLAKKEGATSQHVIVDKRKMNYRRPGFRGNQLTAEEQSFLQQLLREHPMQWAA